MHSTLTVQLYKQYSSAMLNTFLTQCEIQSYSRAYETYYKSF